MTDKNNIKKKWNTYIITINGKGTIIYTSIKIESKLMYYVVQQQYLLDICDSNLLPLVKIITR